MNEIQDWGVKVCASVERVFFGKHDVIEKILASILCRGHILIEDVPGVGKTILARAIAASLGGSLSRIQCTPDLMPADILGISIFNPQKGEFTFRPGPIEANVVLVDEINRATPRTQSALLEAMAEGQVSIDNTIRPLPKPFLLLATENPIDFEGTFPLPEAQKDRFFLSLTVGYPSRESEEMILDSQNKELAHPVESVTAVSSPEEILKYQKDILSVYVSAELRGYILDLADATRTSTMLKLGVSPRGSLALFRGAQALAALRGRDFVVPEDIRELILPVFSKRIILKPDQLLKGITEAIAIQRITENITVPIPGKQEI
jgi:MoxR-like ATPase